MLVYTNKSSFKRPKERYRWPSSEWLTTRELGDFGLRFAVSEELSENLVLK